MVTKHVIIYDAKCKDCRFCVSYPKGKVARHYCCNVKSKFVNITLKDDACMEFEIDNQ